jgi:hypothetical protein
VLVEFRVAGDLEQSLIIAAKQIAAVTKRESTPGVAEARGAFQLVGAGRVAKNGYAQSDSPTDRVGTLN